MFPIFLVQLALLVITVRSIYVVVQRPRTMSWLDILFNISIAIFALSILLPHSYSYYIH
jgi:steroid 5-alpha reductase family enzyme